MYGNYYPPNNNGGYVLAGTFLGLIVGLLIGVAMTSCIYTTNPPNGSYSEFENIQLEMVYEFIPSQIGIEDQTNMNHIKGYRCKTNEGEVILIGNEAKYIFDSNMTSGKLTSIETKYAGYTDELDLPIFWLTSAIY